MSNHIHAPTSRARAQPTGNEEADVNINLGKFDNVPTLTLSEARLLINAVMDNRRAHKKHVEDTEVLIKTQDYLDVFARFKAKENIEAVEQMLAQRHELNYFERSQLGSLCCETAEEAKTLIPSIQNKIDDNDLQELLDDIAKLRNFVE